MGALERILEPELNLTVARNGQRELSEVWTQDVENLVESVGASDSRHVGEEVRVIEGVEQLHAQRQLMLLV